MSKPTQTSEWMIRKPLRTEKAVIEKAVTV